MAVYYFHVAGHRPILEFCAGRDDARRKAWKVSQELSRTWNEWVRVDVMDARGRLVCHTLEQPIREAPGYRGTS